MWQSAYAIKGNIFYSTSPTGIAAVEGGYLLVADGRLAGVFNQLPDACSGLPVEDYGDCLIIPGMTDLHVHAPQFPFRGLGMDLELLDWLNTYTFPEEEKYSDLEYAAQVYSAFADAMRASPTTRAVIFGTVHVPATRLLMDTMEKSGLISYVGKVNMDRNASDGLLETTKRSLADTKSWLEEASGYSRTRPVLTPRFTPSCTDKLMAALGNFKKKFGLPLQSHLSENPSEVAWVRELCPWSKHYAGTYDRFGLLNGRTIMAHCVYLDKEEISLLRKRGCFIAHCPQSNMNLSSGVAPVRKYLDEGLNVGLGTDLAAGTNLSMFRAAADAVAVSKIRWRLLQEKSRPLTFAEAFYMATMGGGKFFGNVGSFLPGFEADILVLPEKRSGPRRGALQERLEQTLLLSGEDVCLRAKYVAGKKIFGAQGTEKLFPEAVSCIPKKYGESPEAVTMDAILRELERLDIPAERLTSKERMQIIAALEKQGIFQLKGIVKNVALGLHCSQASVYRYISQLKIGGIG
ncbi:MAG: amidohydrolase family protein [Fretibacterium sp.]|nr:amidohydrolase family protein [Fretibacterium sp.]